MQEHNNIFIPILRLKWQVQGVMGTCPVAYRFSNPANNGKFMGKHTRWNGRKGWSRCKNGLKGASALAAATHLPPSNEEREPWMSDLIRGETSFGEDVTWRSCWMLAWPRCIAPGALHRRRGGASQRPEMKDFLFNNATSNQTPIYQKYWNVFRCTSPTQQL